MGLGKSVTWCQKWDGSSKPTRTVTTVAENFKKFKQSFEIFQVASGLESKAKEIQSMTLLHVVGSDALEIYNTFRRAEGDCPGECEELVITV